MMRTVPPPSAAPPTTTLADLAVGDRAVVRRVGCNRATAVRLLEMGLVPGTTLEVRRRAPLGDPIELSVRGFSLSLRRVDAVHIDVERATAKEGAS